MKHKKNNKHTKYDIEFMQTIIDGLYERNQELEDEVERLRNEIAETNDDNIQQNEDEQSYRNLTQLNTLLMVLMNLITPHCDDSPLGQAIGLAIKRYQITMAKSLVENTVYIKEEDKELWKEEDDEEENGEEVF